MHIAVDVSDSQDQSPARCAAAAALVRAVLAGLEGGSLKITVWVSGRADRPEPDLVLDDLYKPDQTGRMVTREEREAAKSTFASAFESSCREQIKAVGTRTVSPIHALLGRAAQQHTAACQELAMMGQARCAPGPTFLLMSDLRESGGEAELELRIRRIAEQHRRPKAKVIVPTVRSLALPADAKVIVCGVGEVNTKTKISADHVIEAWRQTGLLPAAVMRPRCTAEGKASDGV